MSLLDTLKRQVDERLLSEGAKRVRAERLTYLSPAKLRRLETAAQRAVRAAPGDILEFGVALGGSAVMLAKIASANVRRFAGFDVFAMIPPPASDKDDQKSKARYEDIAAGRSKGIQGDQYYGYRVDLYADVCSTFSRHGLEVDSDRIQLIKGLFQDTWPLFHSDAIAFAHIDCDWYDPVKYCLDAVAEKLSPGGVIVLDDYNDYGGCRTATEEFLASRSDFAFEGGVNPVLWRTKH